MMIESLDTLVANCAMTRSGGSNDFAFWAKINRVDVVEKFKESVIIKWFKISWVLA